MLSRGKWLALIGSILGIGGAASFALWRISVQDQHEVKDLPPDDVMPPPFGKTKWKGVNAILPLLQNAASQHGIPLGLLVGWIGEESAGRLKASTKLDERGYFQFHPQESAALNIDHVRLSEDPQYSIDAGIKLIQDYIKSTRKLNVAKEGSSYFWRLVKLGHSMGKGQTKKVVEAAKQAGKAGSWEELKEFALGLRINGPQPKKWFPFIDRIYQSGLPFGFGADLGPALVGEICGFDFLGV